MTACFCSGATNRRSIALDVEVLVGRASVVYSLYGFRFAVNEAAYGYCKFLSCEHHDSLWRFRGRRFHRVVWRVSYCRSLGALQPVTVPSLLLV